MNILLQSLVYRRFLRAMTADLLRFLEQPIVNGKIAGHALIVTHTPV
ncbi:MAG: hypothetical protein ACREV2_11350 [Burkholderiales bacterium]